MLKIQNSWQQGDQEESWNTASTRRFVRAATPRTEFQNMKYAHHQYMTKVFHFRQKKLGITAGYSTFSMGSIKDQFVDMGNVHVLVYECSHSSWTELFGEPWRST